MTLLTFEEFQETLSELCPFYNFAVITIEKSCQQDILRTAIWQLILQLKINV